MQTVQRHAPHGTGTDGHDTDLVDPQSFRAAMRSLAAPVTIVTTVDDAGRPWGFTASSVCSLSLDPPLLLVGVARTSSCYEALVNSRSFLVNLLTANHAALATRFATSGIDRFADGPFEVAAGGAYLPDAAALIRCRVAERLTVGDHTLVVGAVAHASVRGGAPLLRHDRTYHTLSPVERS